MTQPRIRNAEMVYAVRERVGENIFEEGRIDYPVAGEANSGNVGKVVAAGEDAVDELGELDIFMEVKGVEAQTGKEFPYVLPSGRQCGGLEGEFGVVHEGENEVKQLVRQFADSIFCCCCWSHFKDVLRRREKLGLQTAVLLRGAVSA